MLIEVFAFHLEHAVYAVHIQLVTTLYMSNQLLNDLLHIQLLLLVQAGVLLTDVPLYFLEPLNVLSDELIRNHEGNVFAFVRTKGRIVLLLDPFLNALPAKEVAALGTLQRVQHQLMTNAALIVLVNIA